MALEEEMEDQCCKIRVFFRVVNKHVSGIHKFAFLIHNITDEG